MKRPQAPLDVLIVEDEALLVMDIEDMISDAGHNVVSDGASLYDVEALPDDLDPDLAFVDLQLARGTSGLDVCRLIRTRWPKTFVVFVTANPKKIPEDFCGAHGVIPKPFSRNGLLSAMRYIEEGVCDPPPTSPAPASFVASPAFAASWA
ncbi:response regulator [Novosphingobium sp. JCM 18896]|uniref:response regulator n=1 Tax=Novosphingobium sp. JCM 18896 TaxID=2989731 RepID=UPI002222DA62|nr:response regulator [Novosphingobium sp. JCM 18896]MCW1432241.1 response regulator [Novosphingobium sp. JCM 18896]